MKTILYFYTPLLVIILSFRCLAQDPLKPTLDPAARHDWSEYAEGVKIPEYLKQESVFQNGEMCGPNSLYAVLQFYGATDISYDEVVKAVGNFGEKGASLQSLVNASNTLGLSCEALKDVSPEDLKNIPKPVIIHLTDVGTTYSSEKNSTKAAALDHFDVVLGYNEESNRFAGIDSTNMRFTYFSGQAFARSMSGYCIAFKGEHTGNKRSLKASLFSNKWNLWFLVAFFALVDLGLSAYNWSVK
ncbi:hypothetical protein Pan153_33020 [Gimesia panareensis]|uniref:Peptidase C39 domain-containing protein n=1 Tax=Gimesia panareensis TaxID=2527978 RepID=A0A518FQL8_9PLAN|nr:cysteine peptidase family C39 domain-containing protein [Gimesia panareensis]QDV18642.1 hypothetical protein Pan153_33020 [Gimesia panareensis]